MTEEVLFIGVENSGKSFIIQQIRNYLSSRSNNPDIIPSGGAANMASKNFNAVTPSFNEYTAPTIGVDILDVTLPTIPIATTIHVRELGAAIQPRWFSYFQNCSIILFILDVSDISLWSTAANYLNECYSYYALIGGKHIICILNKSDLADVNTIKECRNSLKLDEIMTYWRELEIREGSAFDDKFINELLQYITDKIKAK